MAAVLFEGLIQNNKSYCSVEIFLYYLFSYVCNLGYRIVYFLRSDKNEMV